MERFDLELHDLLATAQAQGHLTYDQVYAYSPDEALDSKKIDQLLVELEQLGNRNHRIARCESGRRAGTEDDHPRLALSDGDLPKLTDDPIRMYLSQMCDHSAPVARGRNRLGEEDRDHTETVPPQPALRIITQCEATVRTLHRVHQR